MTGPKNRQFIDAIARSFAVLECLSRVQKPLGNGEIARQTGLPASTISRLIYTLTELGYVRRSSFERSYELTPKNLTLGYPVLAGMSILDRVRPYLKSISESTGETMALAVRDNLHISFVSVIPGSNIVAVRLATGGRLRINVSAAGVALVSAIPEEKRWSMINRLQNDMSKRNEDIAPFEGVLNTCCRDGVAIVRNWWQEGIGGISVPIQWQGKLGALTMPVSTGSVTEQRMRTQFAPELLKAAQEIGPILRGPKTDA